MLPVKHLRLRVTGTACYHCADTIRAHLLREPGVKETPIDLASGASLVSFDPLKTSEDGVLGSGIFARQSRAKVVG